MTKQAAQPENVSKPDFEDLNVEQDVDPLLGCLIVMTKYYQRPMSAQALTAGLPLVNKRLTPQLFIRAAQRADLSAQLNQVEFKKINKLVLPAIAVLKDGRACVITEFSGKNAKVIFPETGVGVTEIERKHLSEKYSGYIYYIKPNYRFSQRSEETFKKPTKNWFWSIFLKAWPIYGEVLVASALVNLFAIAMPLFIMNVYDRVVPNYAIETMWVLASGITIVFMFDFMLKTLRSYFIDIAGKHIDVRLSSIIFQQILGIKMASRPQSVGALANSVQSFEIFRDFMTSTTITVLVDLPFVFLYISVIYMIGGNLALIPLAMIPLVLIIGILLQLPLIKLTQESYQHAAEKQATLIESLSGAEAIKTSSAEGTMQSRWEQVVAISAKLGMKLRMLSNFGVNSAMSAAQFASVLVVIFGVYKISDGDLTTGGLIACTILTGRAMGPLSQIAALFTRYFQSVNALTSLNTIMQLPVERDPTTKHLHRPFLRGDIVFSHVAFNYPEAEIPAINDVSFKINAGEKVAIIGRLGSGKTTVAKLMMQLYQPQAGNVLLDGTDYLQIDPADIRFNVGYVPQDIVLFYGSIRDNIVLGAPHVDSEEVEIAAKIAGVDNFVRKHPRGYDLQVGERGSNLSRGQRQAVAIARAILLNPSILIFDEPSTSMDDSSEAELRAHLMQYLKQNKTFILITHKASMLDLVDRIIVMDNGKLIADGSKEAVLAALKKGEVIVNNKTS